MKSVERICSHRVEFNYRSKSKNAVPNDIEIEHVTASIVMGYTQGELCMNKLVNHREYEFRGWWKITD